MMIKAYYGIADAVDYARFCDVNSFDPDSPYIRSYYKRSVAHQVRHEQSIKARRAAGAPCPVYAIGLTAAIELAVIHLNDNSGHPDKHRCVTCNIEFSGQRICPRGGDHIYCVRVSSDYYNC